MARVSGMGLVVIALSSAAWGALPFVEDFEPNGVDHGIWSKWPEGDEIPFSDSSKNHTADPEATWSARAEEADPWGYVMYADFGGTTGAIYAEVWVYDQMSNDGLTYEYPVSNMLALVAGTPVGSGGWNYSEYLQLGVIAWYDPDGLSETYSIRTKHRDLAGGTARDTGVPRKLGWTKLGIAVDAVADGGQVRFYIDDVLVAVSERTGVAIPYVRLGVNFKSHQYFWYDDVLVTDLLPPDEVRFDTDGDLDVDQDDFAVMQLCHTGASGSYEFASCWRMDVDDDGLIDADDVEAFELCASGPGVAAIPSCDGPPAVP